MDLEWFVRRMQEPVVFHNCNDCKWLNLTEEEQRQRASQGLPVINIPHICEKYHKRVYHRRNDQKYGLFIYSCADCAKDNYEHFIERSKYV